MALQNSERLLLIRVQMWSRNPTTALQLELEGEEAPAAFFPGRENPDAFA
ncbi:MAG: hypothetical protein ACREPI_13455 [Candidatus Dormibacterales bacterium]